MATIREVSRLAGRLLARRECERTEVLHRFDPELVERQSVTYAVR